LAIKPDYAEAHFHKGLACLRLGDFEPGWREYEWRRRTKDWAIPERNFLQLEWSGKDPLAGKTILLYAEQGFGDTIQFCRYAQLIASDARVVLEVPSALVLLLSSLKGIAQIVARGEPLPPFDLYCPLLSLPHAFGTTLATIPGEVPYLAADAAKAIAGRQRLADLPGLRVGLVWSGNPRLWKVDTSIMDRRRSISVEQFRALAAVRGVSFVSLQKGEAASQTRPSGMVIHDWTSELHDFADTAALIEALDLVISVDTSVAHLAGALGKPVWLLNRFDTCWRWLLGRDDSPWYPTLRQFRQSEAGDWDGVLTPVRQALTQLVGGRRERRLAIGQSHQIVKAPATNQASSSSVQTLRQAVAIHQQGKLVEAEELYRQIVSSEPDHFDALQLLGTIKLQQGNNEEAVNLITAALRIKGNSAEALWNLGIALGRLNRHDEALASYENALALRPDDAEAYYIRGIGLKNLGRFDEALASYGKSLVIKPDHVQALNNRGNVLSVRLKSSGVIGISCVSREAV
jgi:tetratricopeptide (TPR) repeat protein